MTSPKPPFLENSPSHPPLMKTEKSLNFRAQTTDPRPGPYVVVVVVVVVVLIILLLDTTSHGPIPSHPIHRASTT